MVGFVILNYKTWELTIKCVENIDKIYGFPHMIYIVDNASPNGSYEKLLEQYAEDGHIRIIQSGENGGYAKGNNIGIKACKSEGINRAIICNNDIVFKESAIEYMLATMDLDNDIAVVSPKFLGPEGEINAKPFCGYQNILQFIGLKSCKNLEVDVEHVNEPVQVISVPGGCLLIDVNKFTEMGAFDEGTFLFCEEGTMSRQAYNIGYKLYYEPKAQVIHYHSATIGRETLFVDKCLMQSALYYWRTYEKPSIVLLHFIYVFWKYKIIAKYIMRKYSDTGLIAALKESRQSYRKLLSRN